MVSSTYVSSVGAGEETCLVLPDVGAMVAFDVDVEFFALASTFGRKLKVGKPKSQSSNRINNKIV